MPVARSLSPRTDSASGTSTVDKLPNPTGYDLNSKWDGEWQEYMQQAALRRVRNKVSARHYQIFDAYVIKGWPTPKVTSTFKVTEANVFKVKSRVVDLLAKEITRLDRNVI